MIPRIFTFPTWHITRSRDTVHFHLDRCENRCFRCAAGREGAWPRRGRDVAPALVSGRGRILRIWMRMVMV